VSPDAAFYNWHPIKGDDEPAEETTE